MLLRNLVESIKDIFNFFKPTSTDENMVRPVPNQAVTLIKQFEGCRLQAYQDSNDIWTIGYGHTGGIKEDLEITQEQAEEYLREDLQNIAPSIIRLVKKMLNNNEYSALLSLTFNIGIGSFENSTLLKLINQKDLNNAGLLANEWLKWDHDAEKNVLNGLLARRREELALYFKPS